MSNSHTVEEVVEPQADDRAAAPEDDRETSGVGAHWCACIGADCADRGCWASRQRKQL